MSDLAGALKRTLEDAFGYVRLRGEISGYRGPHASGHAYFCLKDQSARIDAVIWKSAFARLQVQAARRAWRSSPPGASRPFPGKSKYQIVIETLEPAGIGALMALLEERRRKLTAEGLFAPSASASCPICRGSSASSPRRPGRSSATSCTGSTTAFPARVLVWPVARPGRDLAPRRWRAAIRGFNALDPGGPIPRPDVLIVARGGGSLEDLWGFNEEVVVRAAAPRAPSRSSRPSATRPTGR